MHKKLGLIQVFRGLAALSVVLWHIAASTEFYFKTTFLVRPLIWGPLGVDFFFVLSGFIMVFVHYNDLLRRSNIALFYKKRFIRIYPIYWVIASVSLFFMLYTGKLSLRLDWAYILKSYLLIKQEKSPFLFPAWSLIFEVFFYIVFGVCLMLGFRRSRYIYAGWFILVVVLNIFNKQITFPLAHILAFEPYILEFLFGCLIGYLFHTHFHKLRQHANMIYFAGLMLTLLILPGCIFFLNLSMKNSLLSCLVFGSVFSLLVLGSALKDSNERTPVPNLLYTIGEASYSIYLSHQIVLGLLYKKLSSILSPAAGKPMLIGAGIIAFIAAVIVGILVHLFVEKKLLSILNKWMLPQKKPATKAGLVA